MAYKGRKVEKRLLARQKAWDDIAPTKKPGKRPGSNKK